MENSDEYDIIYEQGVPVLAFQICDAQFANLHDDDITLGNTESRFSDEENQTLQYFKEDEEDEINSPISSLITESIFENDIGSHKFKFKSIPKSDDKNGLEFVIVKNATKYNSKKLYDSHGYSYTLRDIKSKEGSSIWRCRFKIDNRECGAKVKKSGNNEFEMLQNHRHKPDKTISFELLKETGLEPFKPKNQSLKRIHSKSYKSHGINSKKDVDSRDGCEKMLDYFCEGSKLEDSELNANLEVSSETKDESVRYKVIENGSLTGLHILYDSLGYSYSAIEVKGENKKWNCQAHSLSEGNTCEAQVCQNGATFTSSGNHSHKPKRHTLMKINKMKLFSNSYQEECSSIINSSSNENQNPFKKIKTEQDTVDKDLLSSPTIKKEKNRESFEFNSNELSFLVSLENDDKVKNELDETEPNSTENESHITYNCQIQNSLVSDVSPKAYKVEDYSVYRELATIVFKDKGQRIDKLKYHIIEKGSTQGGPKLFDSRGFFYTSKTFSSVKNVVTTWICSHRSGSIVCKAKVRQNSSGFAILKDHCHPSDKEKFIRSLIRAEAIEVIKDPSNVQRPGMSIIRGIIESYGDIVPLKINVDHLVRFVNYQKKNLMSHNENESCKYTFNKKKIPKNFLLNKIKVDHKFHLTFATEIQLAFLASACEWYIDEADLDIPPFTNLLSIHAFTEHPSGPRQMPLFFAFLSDRRETDYSQIFRSILSALTKPPIVSSIVIDLNVPLRRSLAKCFLKSDLKCCDIHWSEDISCKLKEMDLEAFLEDPSSMNFLYQLPLLNLLPRQDFEPALSRIESEVEDDSVRDLICYIRETFGDRSLWPPKYWSCFKMPIRINNHDQWREEILNNASHDEIYSLIRTLYFLAKSVDDNLKLMSKKKIKKYYLYLPESTLCTVYKEWKKYCKSEINCHALLDRLASIIRSF